MTAKAGDNMDGFLEALRVQRWDDHRYYHHSRINQSLHLRQRDQLPVRLCDDVQGSGDRGARRLAGGDDQPPDRPFLLRAQGLRRRQPGQPRAQGRDQGRLQSAAQGGADDDLGAVAASALLRSDAFRHLHAARRQPRIRPPRRRRSGSSSAWAGCCSGPSICSSSRTCRPAWSGRPRSSPTRSTTSSSTTRRRSI